MYKSVFRLLLQIRNHILCWVVVVLIIIPPQTQGIEDDSGT